MNTSTSRLVRHLLTWFCLLLAAPFAHALSMGISLNPDRVRPGEAIVATLTVTNESGAPVSGIVLRTQLPSAGVNGISPSYGSGNATCPGGFCDAGETIEWTLGTLGAGQARRFTFPMTVASAAAVGSQITVPARLLVNGVQQIALSQAVTVSANNALSLNVDARREAVVPGGTLVYDLSYGNRSGASVAGTTLRLPLPAGTALVSATGGGTQVGNELQWALGTLLAGQSGRQQVVVTVGSGLASGTLLPADAAVIAGTSAATGDESARATLVSRVQTSPVLTLAIASNADPARQGEIVRTAFTVGNPTAATVVNAVLQVRMPTESIDGVNPGYFSGGATCPGGFCDAYELVTWNLGTLAPGGSVTVEMLAVVGNSAPSGRPVAFDAELTADFAPLVTARHSVAVDVDNALTLALAADRDPVAPGGRLTYTLTYGNRGDSSVTGPTLELPLPNGVSFVSATGGGVLDGNTVRWPLSPLLAGQSARQQVVANVIGATAGGTLLSIDAAILSGTSATTGAEAARATLATRIHVAPTLGLSTAVQADPARPGEVVRTQFTVTNRSADTPVFNASLSWRMPTAGFDGINPAYFFGGATCPGGFCDASEFVNWDLGTLGPGASVTVSAIAGVSGTMTSGRLVPLESVLRADGLPMTLNRHTLAIDGDNALTLALHAESDSVAPGERVTFVLDYANRSTGTINNTVLTFPVPEGAALLGASSGASLRPGSVSWNLGGLLAGTGGRRLVRLTVPASAPAGQPLRVDAATLAGTSVITGSEVVRATRHVRVRADNPLRLSFATLLPSLVLGSQTPTVALRATNSGPVPVNAVRVVVRLPEYGVNGFSPAALSSGGTCPGGFCDASEFVAWTIPTLAAGASSTVTIPLPISAGVTTGRQIYLEAWATDDNGDESLLSATALVGTQFSPPPTTVLFGDFDGNGVVNFADLALFNAHFGTTTSGPYDLDGNGVVNFADLAIFKTLFGTSLSATGGSDEAAKQRNASSMR